MVGEMRTYPVSSIEILDDNLVRLDTLKKDVRACLKQFMDLV